MCTLWATDGENRRLSAIITALSVANQCTIKQVIWQTVVKDKVMEVFLHSLVVSVLLFGS